jgi:hypothetical protein
LGCAIRWNKPKLGFDLRYHAAFVADVPLETVRTSDLFLILRVTPEQGDAAYFKQTFRTPKEIPADVDLSKASYQVTGSFDAGPGRYRVEWLLRDHQGRACFQTESLLVPVTDGVQLKPNQIVASLDQEFKQEMCLHNSSESTAAPVHLYVNYASSRPGLAAPAEHDREALLSMIRLFARDCSISQLNLTVFDLERQHVLYRNDLGRVDFAELGNALSGAQHGTIAINTLSEPRSSVAFVQDLTAAASGPILFIGPAASGLNTKVPEGATFSSCEKCAYLHYEPQPVVEPDWIDAVGRWIRRVRGTKFDIRQPRDLLHAFPQISRMIRAAPAP